MIKYYSHYYVLLKRPFEILILYYFLKYNIMTENIMEN